DDYTKSVIEGALKRTFSPEFLNRVDDVIIFNPLNEADIHKIIDLQLQLLYNRIHTMGYNIKVTDGAKSFLAEKGYDPAFGARPLRRVIQKYMEDSIAEEILKSEINEGDSIVVDLKDKKDKEQGLAISVEHQAPKEKPARSSKGGSKSEDSK